MRVQILKTQLSLQCFYVNSAFYTVEFVQLVPIMVTTTGADILEVSLTIFSNNFPTTDVRLTGL